jgi:hypothetical protein
MFITTEAGKYNITVTTRQEVVHKLDKKYIDLLNKFCYCKS